MKVTRWNGQQPPTADELWQRMRDEGLRPYSWSNGPATRYTPHEHSYRKIIYVVEGSIHFDLPDQEQQIDLEPGDRLELPPGVAHSAMVGPTGVRCLEAQA